MFYSVLGVDEFEVFADLVSVLREAGLRRRWSFLIVIVALVKALIFDGLNQNIIGN